MPGRPTSDVAAALPDRILDAAEALFLAQGFAATSLNQIAAAAGATKRTLYSKVGDKAGIFAAAIRRLLDRRRESLNDPDPDASCTERLVHFGDALMAIVLDPPILRLMRILVAEAPRFPELAALMEEQIARGARANLAELLRDEVARRRLALADPEGAAELLLGMITYAPQRAALFGLPAWPAERRAAWVRGAIALFLDGAELAPR